uniref:Uncharacterized protein LOC110195309 n=1 Tax=Phascolarctos cinereus TaxID=38626 RepID=A0A6P5IXF6_PHACI|nr:uncharacterized protein LOC110195309 [Phascolarctos cinereus]
MGKGRGVQRLRLRQRGLGGGCPPLFWLTLRLIESPARSHPRQPAPARTRGAATATAEAATVTHHRHRGSSRATVAAAVTAAAWGPGPSSARPGQRAASSPPWEGARRSSGKLLPGSLFLCTENYCLENFSLARSVHHIQKPSHVEKEKEEKTENIFTSRSCAATLKGWDKLKRQQEPLKLLEHVGGLLTRNRGRSKKGQL